MLAVGHKVEFQTDQGSLVEGIVRFYWKAIGVVIVTDRQGELWKGHDDQVKDLSDEGGRTPSIVA